MSPEKELHHALVLPYPAQGHVIPLLELSYCLLDHGFTVTFLVTDFDHRRVLAAISGSPADMGQIRLVSIPDGLGPEEDRRDLGRLTEGILTVMPSCLEEIIRKAEQTEEEGERFTCLIADESMGWAFAVAKRMKLRCAAFWPAAAGILVMILSIPKLIEDGVIDEHGRTKKKGKFQLAPGLPDMDTAHFVWSCLLDEKTKEMAFRYILNNIQAANVPDHIICNSFFDAERPVFAYFPNILPVGPLLTGQRLGKSVGHFWPQDSSCKAWLDVQQPNTVLYVAFGSFTVFGDRQLQELALGLESTGVPFLWVVRPDILAGESIAFPEEFESRVRSRGKMVRWAPQQEVLGHPAVACFMSHCGWNSTMEGVRNGIPFLCWPYFADQHFNQIYICDVWRTGLKITPDENGNGNVSGGQIAKKFEELMADGGIKERALALKEMATMSVRKGGTSLENFNAFVKAMKERN